jgi:hypothetical protein
MGRGAWVCLLLLLGVLVVSILSRTVADASPGGKHLASAVKATCSQLMEDASLLRLMSNQDDILGLAISHNAEASACVRAVLALAQHYGSPPPPGALELQEELREEREAVVSALEDAVPN